MNTSQTLSFSFGRRRPPIVVDVAAARDGTRPPQASSAQSKLHITPKKDRVTVKKSDLVDSKTQNPLQLRNKALLSLDGGGLRGILTGA